MALTATEQAELDALKASFTPEEDQELQALRAMSSPQPGSAEAPVQLNAQGQPVSPLPPDTTAPQLLYTTPGYQGLQVFHEGGTISRNRTPLEEQMRADQAARTKEAATVKESLLPSIGSIGGTALGGALGGLPGAALGDIVGTTAGYGANLALGLETLDPVKAALLLGPTYIANAWQTVRPLAQALARSSTPGKTALENVRRINTEKLAGTVDQLNTQGLARQGAADDAVAAFNAHAQADYLQTKAQRDAVKTQLQFDYQNDLAAWQAIEAKNAAEKLKYAEDLRNFTQAFREGNVSKAAQFAANLPGIPDHATVQASYAAAQAMAENYATPIVFPQIQAVKKAFLAEAASLKKITGPTPLTRQMEAMARAGQTKDGPAPLTLTGIQSALSTMKAHAASLKRSTSEYAGAQLRIYSRLIEATEAGLEALAKNEGLPAQFRLQLKMANAEYLKESTHAELTDFLTHDLLRPGPGGVPQFSPQNALRALENKSNAPLKRYMQQTIFEEEGGANLYDLTVKTLRSMASEGVEKQQALRLLRRTGDTPVPPRPTDPTAHFINVAKPQPAEPGPRFAPYPGPGAYQPGDTSHGRGAILANAALRVGGPLVALGLQQAGVMGGVSPYTAVGMGGALSVGAPNLIAQLMMRPEGQRTLLKLIETQGTRLTPQMVGFLSAATRSQLSGEGSQP